MSESHPSASVYSTLTSQGVASSTSAEAVGVTQAAAGSTVPPFSAASYSGEGLAPASFNPSQYGYHNLAVHHPKQQQQPTQFQKLSGADHVGSGLVTHSTTEPLSRLERLYQLQLQSQSLGSRSTLAQSKEQPHGLWSSYDPLLLQGAEIVSATANLASRPSFVGGGGVEDSIQPFQDHSSQLSSQAWNAENRLTNTTLNSSALYSNFLGLGGGPTVVGGEELGGEPSLSSSSFLSATNNSDNNNNHNLGLIYDDDEGLSSSIPYFQVGGISNSDHQHFNDYSTFSFPPVPRPETPSYFGGSHTSSSSNLGDFGLDEEEEEEEGGRARGREGEEDCILEDDFGKGSDIKYGDNFISTLYNYPSEQGLGSDNLLGTRDSALVARGEGDLSFEEEEDTLKTLPVLQHSSKKGLQQQQHQQVYHQETLKPSSINPSTTGTTTTVKPLPPQRPVPQKEATADIQIDELDELAKAVVNMTYAESRAAAAQYGGTGMGTAGSSRSRRGSSAASPTATGGRGFASSGTGSGGEEAWSVVTGRGGLARRPVRERNSSTRSSASSYSAATGLHDPPRPRTPAESATRSTVFAGALSESPPATNNSTTTGGGSTPSMAMAVEDDSSLVTPTVANVRDSVSTPSSSGGAPSPAPSQFYHQPTQNHLPLHLAHYNMSHPDSMQFESKQQQQQHQQNQTSRALHHRAHHRSTSDSIRDDGMVMDTSNGSNSIGARAMLAPLAIPNPSTSSSSDSSGLDSAAGIGGGAAKGNPSLNLIEPSPWTAVGPGNHEMKGKGTLELERVLGMNNWPEKVSHQDSLSNYRPPQPFPRVTSSQLAQASESSRPSFAPQFSTAPAEDPDLTHEHDNVSDSGSHKSTNMSHQNTKGDDLLEMEVSTPSPVSASLGPYYQNPRKVPTRQRSKSEADVKGSRRAVLAALPQLPVLGSMDQYNIQSGGDGATGSGTIPHHDHLQPLQDYHQSQDQNPLTSSIMSDGMFATISPYQIRWDLGFDQSDPAALSNHGVTTTGIGDLSHETNDPWRYNNYLDQQLQYHQHLRAEALDLAESPQHELSLRSRNWIREDGSLGGGGGGRRFGGGPGYEAGLVPSAIDGTGTSGGGRHGRSLDRTGAIPAGHRRNSRSVDFTTNRSSAPYLQQTGPPTTSDGLLAPLNAYSQPQLNALPYPPQFGFSQQQQQQQLQLQQAQNYSTAGYGASHPAYYNVLALGRPGSTNHNPVMPSAVGIGSDPNLSLTPRTPYVYHSPRASTHSLSPSPGHFSHGNKQDGGGGRRRSRSPGSMSAAGSDAGDAYKSGGDGGRFGGGGGGGSVALSDTGDDVAAVGEVQLESKTTQATIQAAKKRRAPGTAANFICELCGESFTRRYNLRGHQRAHRNEKPFSCSFDGCSKSFARAHDCKRHELLHQGVRRYHCEPCQRDFVRLDALQRHHRSDAGQACVGTLRSLGYNISYDTTASGVLL